MDIGAAHEQQVHHFSVRIQDGVHQWSGADAVVRLDAGAVVQQLLNRGMVAIVNGGKERIVERLACGHRLRTRRPMKDTPAGGQADNDEEEGEQNGTNARPAHFRFCAARFSFVAIALDRRVQAGTGSRLERSWRRCGCPEGEVEKVDPPMRSLSFQSNLTKDKSNRPEGTSAFPTVPKMAVRDSAALTRRVSEGYVNPSLTHRVSAGAITSPCPDPRGHTGSLLPGHSRC